MSAASIFHSLNLPSAFASNKIEDGERLLVAYREWANLEIDKIQLSARLIGVKVDYMPNYDGRKFGMEQRCKQSMGATCHVKSQPLLGQLWFHCDKEIFETKIRVPGVNAEYRYYDYNGQEQKAIYDENGMTTAIICLGPHRYEIHHSTGKDIIE